MKKGTVIKSTGSFYTVKCAKTIYNCSIAGKFRIKGLRSTNPVTVGDIVEFKIMSEEQKHGLIKKIHERKNFLSRKSTNLSKKSHILAANIDLAIVIATLKSPQTYTLFIDRFLVAAEKSNIRAAVIFNKTDIYDKKESEYLEYVCSMYKSIGYPVLAISVKENKNIDQVNELIKNKIIIVAGNSGVGKSSLINKLEPGLKLKTTEVTNSHGLGKHTTTFAEMFPVGNAQIIDSPGIKGFGLVDIDYDRLSHYFPEMNKIRKRCKFNNCSHTHEPGCVVKQAAENFEISHDRYNNYLKILNDQKGKYREDIYE